MTTIARDSITITDYMDPYVRTKVLASHATLPHNPATTDYHTLEATRKPAPKRDTTPLLRHPNTLRLLNLTPSAFDVSHNATLEHRVVAGEKKHELPKNLILERKLEKGGELVEPYERIRVATKKNQKRFEELMQSNWDDKITSLKNQMSQMKAKPKYQNREQRSIKSLREEASCPKRKAVQFCLPEI